MSCRQSKSKEITVLGMTNLKQYILLPVLYILALRPAKQKQCSWQQTNPCF